LTKNKFSTVFILLRIKVLQKILNSAKRTGKIFLLSSLLTAGSFLGCSEKTKDMVTNPEPQNQAPIAVMNIDPKTGEAPLDVSFDGSGSYDLDGQIKEYAWDFDGDGTYDEVGLENKLSHNYADPGVYNASLRVVDDKEAFGYTQTQIDVGESPEISVDFFDNKNIKWIAYAPTNFNPDLEQFPSEESVRADLNLLYDHNFKGIFTYGADDILGNVPRIAKEIGFPHVVMGIWSLESPEEWNNALDAVNYVDGYCVGNEGLSAGRYTIGQLEEKLESLREATKKPATTTEALSEYDVNLLELGDWVFPNCHPYWQGITNPENAASWTLQQYDDLSGKTSKIVVLKEVGLPSEGNIGLSEENQNNYYRLLEDLMEDKSNVSFAYFEAFDQEWKNWAEVEPHWGLFDKDRNEKDVSQPQILHTFVPPRGSYSNLQGRVVNVLPENYRTSTYIKVGSTWWMKPYWSWPLSSIREDSKFTTDITTGGIDNTASKVNSYLVVPDYAPVKHVLPNVNDAKVITEVSTDR